LLKSDPRQYDPLVAMIQTDYMSGQDKYPKTISRAYDMIVNYVQYDCQLCQSTQTRQSGSTGSWNVLLSGPYLSKDVVEVAAYQDKDMVVGVNMDVIISMVSQNFNKVKMTMRMKRIISWNASRNSNM
jgi:hypothetical protein